MSGATGCDTKVSLVITTYNWPEALGKVLESTLSQSDRDFEVIVADDGSRPETAALVADFAARAPFPVKHFWHEDDGFRVAAARNGAVSLAEGGYLIFIDGDCCLLPDFIASHRRLAARGKFVSGRRVYLKKRFTKWVFGHWTAFFRWPRGLWFCLGLLGQCNRPFQFLSALGIGKNRDAKADSWEGVQTCNLAVWREDFERIDGFDESYVGHGLEDSDFTLRLIRSGVRRKTADYCSPVLHLYHSRSIPERADREARNPERFRKLQEEPARFLPVKGFSSRKREAS